MQLEIQGNKYGLQWGIRSFVLAEKRLDMSLSQIVDSAYKHEVILTLTYCAMTNWYQLKDETLELPFTYPEFCAWMDDQTDEVGLAIENSYLDSNLQGKSMRKRYEEANAILNAGIDEGTSKPIKKKKSLPPKS